MMYTLICVIVGDTRVFTVDIDGSRTVDALKDAIKVKQLALAPYNANHLKLYRVNVDVSNMETRTTTILQIFQNPKVNWKELDSLDVISKCFKDALPEKHVNIVVELPPVATLPAGFRELRPWEYPNRAPVQIYRNFYANPMDITRLKPGDTIKLHSHQLKETSSTLYFFKQYEYMKERIDKLRVKPPTPVLPEPESNTVPRTKTAVIITGTPGIGKSTFLDYILACEAAAGQRVIYWAYNELYLFDRSDIYLMEAAAATPLRFSDSWYDALCLVDTLGSYPLPLSLLCERYLFVVQAASPNPEHTEWSRKRTSVRTFVLNPPEDREMIEALRLHGLPSDEEILRASIKHYGYNMRSLFAVLTGQSERVEMNIKSRLNGLSIAQVESMLTGSDAGLRSHTLVMSFCANQPRPDEVQYFKSDLISYTVAGASVYKALIRSYGAAFYKQIRFTAGLFNSVSRAATMGGWVWEGFCHEAIPKLPHLDLIRMAVSKGKLVPTDKVIQVPIGPLAHQVYTDKHSTTFTADATKYYIPSAPNNPAFDAFLRSDNAGIGLQMTLRTDHSLAESGLKKLQTRLSTDSDDGRDCYFAFVIPKGQVFECKAPAKQWRDVFTFFILELHDSCTLLIDDTMEMDDESAGWDET